MKILKTTALSQWSLDKALYKAAEYQNVDIVEFLLLEMHADLNAEGSDVQMAGKLGGALYRATKCGSILACASYKEPDQTKPIGTVARLLERGVDVNLQGGIHGRALQAACRMSRVENIKSFLCHGVDATLEGGFFGSALGAAAALGEIEITEVLLGSELKLQSQIVTMALFTAVHWRQLDAVKILENGVDIRAKHDTYNSIMDVLEERLSEEEEREKHRFDPDNDANADSDYGPNEEGEREEDGFDSEPDEEEER